MRLLASVFVLASVPRVARAGDTYNAEEFYSAKCSACLAFSRELQLAIVREDEQSHQNMEVKQRLDLEGNRVGKTIVYRLSETRAYNIMDSVCLRMKNYDIIVDGAKGTRVWRKTSNTPRFKSPPGVMNNGYQGNTNQRQLHNFCDRTLEEHEDEFFELVQNSELGVSFDDKVCGEIAPLCADIPYSSSIAQIRAAMQEKAFQKDQDLADQLAKAAEKMAEVKAKVAVIGEETPKTHSPGKTATGTQFKTSTKKRGKKGKKKGKKKKVTTEL